MLDQLKQQVPVMRLMFCIALHHMRLQFDQGRSRCDGTITEIQMLITTYNTFIQSHSQVRADCFSVCSRPPSFR